MKILLFAIPLTLLGGTTLVTEYKKERSFHVDHDVRYNAQVTEIEIEVDGERQDPPDTPRPKSETHWQLIQDDQVLAADAGHPTHVRRHFDTVGGTVVVNAGGDDRREEVASPFKGLTLDLTREGDDVHVEVVEGTKPEHDGALSGHELALCLDALLPTDAVDKDATWELENDAIRRALGVDLHNAFFPRTDDDAQGGGEGRGRRRMGQMMGGGRGFLAQTEWTGTATLTSLSEDVDGTKCAKIELTLHSQGELPEPPPGSGGRRGGRFPTAVLGSTAAIANTYDIALEGNLFFAIETHRPVRLDLAGKLSLETHRESTREEHTMRFHTKSEGEVAIRVEVSEVKAGDKGDK